MTHNCVFCLIVPYLVKDNDVKCSRQQAATTTTTANATTTTTAASRACCTSPTQNRLKKNCRAATRLNFACEMSENAGETHPTHAQLGLPPSPSLPYSTLCLLPCQPFVSCQTTTIITKQTVESISNSTSGILSSVIRQQSRPEHGRCRGF